METSTPHHSSTMRQMMMQQSGQENADDVQEDLVTSLRNRLMSSRSKLHVWVEEQKAVCDTLTNRYRNDKNTFQDQIHTKSQSLLAFKLERGLNLSDKQGEDKNHSHSDQQQDEQEEAMKESIQRLKEKVNAQMIALEDLKEQKMEKEAIPGIKPLDDSGNPIKERHDELMSIVQGYHDITGLSFEKAENERLRFSFTGLDKNDRSRPFSFLLSTSPEDMYVVEECDPPIPDDQLTHLVHTLNENEDMLNFFQEIRSTWSAMVV